MTSVLPLALIAVLSAVALLHAYWGLGGRWPGTDEASLSRLVIGNTPRARMAPPRSCFAVAAAILAGAALTAAVSFVQAPPLVAGLILIAYAVFTAVFLLRGTAGFIPALWRRSAGTPFARLNRTTYSPLCLAIGAGLAANAIWR